MPFQRRSRFWPSSLRTLGAIATSCCLGAFACGGGDSSDDEVPGPTAADLGESCEADRGDSACVTGASCIARGGDAVCVQDGSDGTSCTSTFGCTNGAVCLSGTCRDNAEIRFGFDACTLSASVISKPAGAVAFEACDVTFRAQTDGSGQRQYGFTVLLSATGDDSAEAPAPGSLVLRPSTLEGTNLLTLGMNAQADYSSDSGSLAANGTIIMSGTTKLFGTQDPVLDTTFDFGTVIESLDNYGDIVIGDGDDAIQFGGYARVQSGNASGSGGSGGGGGSGGSGGGGGSSGSGGGGGSGGSGATGDLCDSTCEAWEGSPSPTLPQTLCGGVPGEYIGGYYEVEDTEDCRVRAACSFCLRANGSELNPDNPSNTGYIGIAGTDWGALPVHWRVISDAQCGNPSADVQTDSRGVSVEKAYGIVFRYDEVPRVDGVQVSGEDLHEDHTMLWYKTTAGDLYLNGYNGRQKRISMTCP